MTTSSRRSLRAPAHPPRTRQARPIRTRALAGIGMVLGLLCSVPAAMLGATAASAVVATGHGAGYESSDGYWIGSYRLADGGTGFCINLGRSAPTGNDFEFADAATLGWYSADDRARLAYLSRTWAGTADATVAASAQLATWMITGLEGRDPAALAARAGAHAAQVLAGAAAMIAEADGQNGASRSVSATAVIERGDDGTDTVRAELDVDAIAGAGRVPGGRHTGVISLSGAVFEDGTADKSVTNGTRYAIMPTTDRAVGSVGAEVRFVRLPYGSSVTVGRNTGNVQNLLIASAASATAAAHAEIERPTAKKFQPTVQTRTSAVTAAVGTAVSDALTIGLADIDGFLGQWGVYGPDGGPYTPVPVTVRSRLLGPFQTTPTPADAPPNDAPVVCSVQTPILNGPGEYHTSECTLPGPGFYVWVETIEPDDTRADAGRLRVSPWHSRFGEAAEVTQVAAPPAPQPLTPAAASGAQLADTGSAADPRVLTAVCGMIGLGGVLLGLEHGSRHRRRRGHRRSSVRASRSARS